MALNNSAEALNGKSPYLYHKTRCVKRMKGLQHSSPSWDTLVVIAEFWRDRRCCGETKTTNIIQICASHIFWGEIQLSKDNRFYCAPWNLVSLKIALVFFCRFHKFERFR